MRLANLACVAGHRWTEAGDVHESFPVLRCRRCGRTRTLAAGTQPEGWGDRAYRQRMADRYVDGGTKPPRP